MVVFNYEIYAFDAYKYPGIFFHLQFLLVPTVDSVLSS